LNKLRSTSRTKAAHAALPSCTGALGTMSTTSSAIAAQIGSGSPPFFRTGELFAKIGENAHILGHADPISGSAAHGITLNDESGVAISRVPRSARSPREPP
jgi:hypothetical protein